MCHIPRRRRGLTLVELLAVIAIIGLLVGLLLPAVNSVRESGRRMRCQGNLKQIALATLQHQHSLGRLPPAFLYDPKHVAMAPLMFWLLPYMELRSEYDTVMSTAGNFPSGVYGTTRLDARTILLMRQVPTLLCTSDYSSPEFGYYCQYLNSGTNSAVGGNMQPAPNTRRYWAATNYVFNLSVFGQIFGKNTDCPITNIIPAYASEGPLCLGNFMQTAPDSIPDGTSKTIGFSEKLSMPNWQTSTGPYGTCWAASWHNADQFFPYFNPGGRIGKDLCRASGLPSSKPPGKFSGKRLYDDMVLGQSNMIQDRPARDASDYRFVHAIHGGAVQSAMLDGRVTSFDVSIDFRVMAAMLYTDDGQVVSEP
jgi:prepilin-type N-terminal cleavage/methylation domain-containing protein